MKYSSLIAIFFIILLNVKLNAALAQDTKRILGTGSSTVAPLVSELVVAYEKLHPLTRIDIELGGSSRGIVETRRGLVDFGMVSRALKPEESDLVALTIAWDGLALIINGKNPVKELSDSQIVDIYKGKIINWQTVGGLDGAITVVNKAQGRATLELFLDYFKLKPIEIKAHTIIGDNQQGIKLVSRNPNAIPSVVYGLVGLTSLVPLINYLSPPGSSFIAGVLILSLMITPTATVVIDTGFDKLYHSSVYI